NQNRISQTYELSGINIPIDLWVLCELTIDYVFSGELSFIFIETVGDENRNIIRPRVSWSRTEQYPVVFACDIKKGFNPGSRPNYTLLIKYKECSMHVLILFDVVPAVDYDFVFVKVHLGIF